MSNEEEEIARRLKDLGFNSRGFYQNIGRALDDLERAEAEVRRAGRLADEACGMAFESGREIEELKTALRKIRFESQIDDVYSNIVIAAKALGEPGWENE